MTDEVDSEVIVHTIRKKHEVGSISDDWMENQVGNQERNRYRSTDTLRI